MSKIKMEGEQHKLWKLARMIHRIGLRAIPEDRRRHFRQFIDLPYEQQEGMKAIALWHSNKIKEAKKCLK
jgi:hypothetical protein